MICPKCQTENPNGRRFVTNAEQNLNCLPQCGFVNPPEMQILR